MGTIFKYNNQLYQCNSLEKKLKRMKITQDDIEVIMDCEDAEKWFNTLVNTQEKESEEDNIYKYYFVNDKGESITSIYNEVPEGYKPTTYKQLLELWNKHVKELLT
jgi:SOS response regulatory protein OraA/RecX